MLVKLKKKSEERSAEEKKESERKKGEDKERLYLKKEKYKMESRRNSKTGGEESETSVDRI